jgi:hypothetical protein
MGGSLWWHMPVGPTKKIIPNINHMKGSASLLFEQFLLSSVIYMVAQLLWLSIISP